MAGPLGSLALSAIMAVPGLTGSSGARAEAQPPVRIVSLNLCTDLLLVHLVARERIAALSILAADPSVSAIAARTAGLALVRGEAEAVLAKDPDLIVTSAYASPATVAILRRLGRRVVTLPLAGSFEGIRDSIRTLAAAVGEPERGAEMIASFDERLALLKTGDDHRPTAVAVEIGSLVATSGSLLDEAMRWVGFANGTASRRLGPGNRLPLEVLVADPPDLIVLANNAQEFRTAAADNLRHPALKALLQRQHHVVLPLPAWLCGSPHVLASVAQLAAARRGLMAKRPRDGGAPP